MDENNKRPTKKTTEKRLPQRRPSQNTLRRPTVKRSAPKANTPKEPMSRDEVRKQKYLERRRIRRRNRLISYCAIAFLVAVIAIIIVISVFFKISAINVTGDEVYTQEEIITASGIKVGDNMFAFNKNDVCEGVQTKLPYVEKLTIKRSPTGKVTLTVQGAVAAMAIENADAYLLLTSSCKVLEENSFELPGTAARVQCSAVTSAVSGTRLQLENAEDVEMLCNISKLLSDRGLTKITGINILDYSYIKLNYDNRINLKVGSYTTLSDNIEFIKAALERQDAEEPSFTGAIDFTITDRAFVNAVDEDETTTVPKEYETVTDENGEPVTNEKGEQVTAEVQRQEETGTETESETKGEETTTKKAAA